jgi:hypothetical protein
VWAAAGIKPGQTDVAAYWIRVMAANRDRLPVPADPSLLFPGDLILLPQVPPPP